MIRAAFFDLDGTLFTGHIWRGLAEHHRAHRTHRALVYVYLVTHMGLWLLHLARLVKEEPFYAAWVRHMPWLMAGFSEEEGQVVFRRLCDDYVLPRLRPDVMELVHRHQAEGRPVVLVSGTFQGLLEVIAEALGLQGAVGTRLRLRKGRYTGDVIEPICFGAGKVERLRQYLAQHPEIDLAASYAYADSIYDVPLLEIVSHPVAVYPEARLATIARQRGWPIIGEIRGEK